MINVLVKSNCKTTGFFTKELRLSMRIARRVSSFIFTESSGTELSVGYGQVWKDLILGLLLININDGGDKHSNK